MAEKFEREIEEIIRNSGSELPPPPRSARRSVRRARSTGRNWRLGIKAGPMMMASVALLLVGVLLWNVSNGLGGLMMLGAVILFLLSYMLFFGRWATGGAADMRSDGVGNRSRMVLQVRRLPYDSELGGSERASDGTSSSHISLYPYAGCSEMCSVRQRVRLWLTRVGQAIGGTSPYPTKARYA